MFHTFQLQLFYSQKIETLTLTWILIRHIFWKTCTMHRALNTRSCAFSNSYCVESVGCGHRRNKKIEPAPAQTKPYLLTSFTRTTHDPYLSAREALFGTGFVGFWSGPGQMLSPKWDYIYILIGKQKLSLINKKWTKTHY